jgi:hypothetical protein
MNQTVSGQNGHVFVQLLGLQAHSAGKVVFLETTKKHPAHEDAKKAASDNGCQVQYLHRITRKLVQDDCVLSLIECSRNMLDKETKCVLILLGRH